MRNTIWVVFVLSLMLAAGPGAGQDDEEPIEALQEGVDSLRAEGDFAGALVTAKELLAVLQSGDDTKFYQIEDAERLTGTLQLITTMSADDQNKLARAAQLGQEYFALYDEDDIVGAASLAREQLDIITTHLGANHPETAKSMNNLAYLLEELGEYDTVGVLYEEALEIDRQALGNLHPDVASDLNNLGTFVQDKGDYPASESMLREALAIYTGTFGDVHPDVAMVYNNLGNLFEETGDLAAAEPLFRRSIFVYREVYGSVDEDVATGLHNLAALLARKGDYAEAEALFTETLEIYRELEADFDLALTLNSAASVLHDQDNYAGAEPLYEEALKRFRDTLGDENAYVAATLNNLAGLYHDTGDYEKADRFYREALDIRREMLGSEHTKVAIVLLNLARNYRDWGRYDEAEPLYKESLGILKSGFGNEHPDVARCLYSMGNYYVATGDYGQAQFVLREAVAAYEASRLRVGEGVGRAVFQQSPYPKLAYTSLELKKPVEAWPAAEKALGRVLAELIVVSGRRALNPDEEAREKDLLDEIGAAEDELTAYLDALRENEDEETQRFLDSTRNHLFELQTDLGAFQREMAGKYPVSEGQSYPLSRIQKSIPQRAAIIGWLDVEAKENEYDSWVYVIPGEGAVQWARVPSRDDDDRSPFDRTRAFRDALVSPEGAVAGLNRDAKALWSERIKPLKAALRDIEHLIVIPSGAMLGIPVEALVDDEGEALAERYIVSYTPSATVFCWLNEQPNQSDRAGRALLVGDPPFCDAHLASGTTSSAGTETRKASSDEDVSTLRFAVVRDKAAVASLPRLEGTRSEVTSIAVVVESPTVLLGEDASENELAQLADTGKIGEFGTIHIATHALIDDRRPELSALVLSQVGLPDPLESAMKKQRIIDGLVTAREVVREWNLSADIVTLSACETGLGRKAGSEGYIGFSHAFFQAGARSVLVSLWKVDDLATSLLMQKFYEVYFNSENTTKAAALQDAKKWVKNYTDGSGVQPFEHSFYWSGFVLIGDAGRSSR